MSLSPDERNFQFPNAQIEFYKEFYDEEKSNRLFQILMQQTNWKSYTIKIFGKEYDQPRLTAFYDNSGKGYKYSNIELESAEMSGILLEIKDDILKNTGYHFNSVLLNLYRNGRDSNGWHSDDEAELGVNPIIASLSLGESRYFHFKHNKIKSESHKIILPTGSLLVMAGEMQQHWKHQISKTTRAIGKRINLTFRKL